MFKLNTGKYSRQFNKLAKFFITIEEIETAFKNFPTNKSSGPESFTSEF